MPETTAKGVMSHVFHVFARNWNDETRLFQFLQPLATSIFHLSCSVSTPLNVVAFLYSYTASKPAYVRRCVRVYVCTCVRVYVCACVRVYVCARVRTCSHVCARVHVCARAGERASGRAGVCVCEFVRVRVSASASVSFCPGESSEEPENETHVLHFSLRTGRGVNQSEKMRYRRLPCDIGRSRDRQVDGGSSLLVVPSSGGDGGVGGG